MITKFEVGKTYRFNGKSRVRMWAREMCVVLDHKPRQCIAVEGGGYMALLEGIPSVRNDRLACWHMDVHNAGWEEVPQFQRGERVWVWDFLSIDGCSAIFISELIGAKDPFVVVRYCDETLYEMDEPFETVQYQHCTLLPVVDEKLVALKEAFDMAKKAYVVAERAMHNASHAIDKYNERS